MPRSIFQHDPRNSTMYRVGDQRSWLKHSHLITPVWNQLKLGAIAFGEVGPVYTALTSHPFVVVVVWRPLVSGEVVVIRNGLPELSIKGPGRQIATNPAGDSVFSIVAGDTIGLEHMGVFRKPAFISLIPWPEYPGYSQPWVSEAVGILSALP